MGSHTNLEIVSQGGRLDSWKEIAAYLGRSERTVRRWEDQEGLPVHRLAHEKRGSVYAYRSELDAWWNSRKEEIADEEEVAAFETAAPELNAVGDRPSPVEPPLEAPTECGRQSQQPTLESRSVGPPLQGRPTRVLWAITGLVTVALALSISIAYRATLSQPLRPLMRFPVE